ncbi:3-deoxy-7-phosphoheptulonate synthase [Streptomyces sp. NA04227]|uniref:3-deoxy-7-phosphoheptulonate synthase n=1 Tax=Streptomyces sp. NA04227 TaxID=2742136 RepID=UPI001590F00D|nr:3-deoxy-7-phosphoheptulonate synthase [Streptomyces sp. NA04227]QKW08091.1 3-deoxy-7-phosphoheptulonate synthase [Streptomyces sp. NA04227]
MNNSGFLDRGLPAAQQPEWEHPHQVAQVRNVLSATDALVSPEQILALRESLADVARGEGLVLQAGDCAEHPDECGEAHIAAKAGLVNRLAEALGEQPGVPVLRVGRIAGQFAKPRSKPTEEIDGLVLPAYRGHIVNAPEVDEHSRRPDPLRMLMCFMASREAMQHLGWRQGGDWATRAPEDRVWSSHEALLIDYEEPQLRKLDDGRLWLSSTHWPWIGERTRQLDGAHVELLSKVVNPVACKVGPTMTPDELLELCARLDPEREPGRLTLIVRMGAEQIGERLPALVRAVRDNGHPVLWFIDPMHGNTVKLADGTKSRDVTTVSDEVRQFLSCLAEAGVRAHGLHLEASPYAVGECFGGFGPRSAPGTHGTGMPSLCDPRLDPDQAAEVVAAWSDVQAAPAASALSKG